MAQRAPELVDAVKNGNMTLKDAAKAATPPKPIAEHKPAPPRENSSAAPEAQYEHQKSLVFNSLKESIKYVFSFVARYPDKRKEIVKELMAEMNRMIDQSERRTQ